MPANMDVGVPAAIHSTQHSYFRTIAGAANLEGDYLEIGPDVGHVARHAARDGKFAKFWFFEPNEGVHAELAGSVRGKPCHISSEMTDLSEVPDGSVGVAVMVHVLDHLADPVDLLRQNSHQTSARRCLGNRYP